MAHELGESSLDRERGVFDSEAYYRRLGGMADLILELRDYLDKHGGNIEEETAHGIVSRYEETAGLLDKDIDNIMAGLERHQEGKNYIDTLLTHYSPEEIFQNTFGFPPTREVATRNVDGYLVFILAAEDFMGLESTGNNLYGMVHPGGVTGGCYLNPQSFRIKDQGLMGKVILIPRILNYSSRGTKKILFRKETDIVESIDHEVTHAISQDLFLPLLDESVERSRQDGEKSKLALIFLQHLNVVKEAYFAGGFHNERFVSEFGPARLNAFLRDDGEVERAGEGHVLDSFIEAYRKHFFVLFDVLETVQGRMDHNKLMILAFLLPADRIERLLHFVGVDPTRWKKEWVHKHTDADLRRREDDEIIKRKR